LQAHNGKITEETKLAVAKELNEELRICEFCEDILDIVQDEAGNFNHVNASTALLKIAKLSSSLHQAARQEVLRDPRFDRLMEVVRLLAVDMRPRELCSVMQSLVYLRYQSYSTMKAVMLASQFHVADFNHRDASSMVWAMASLKVSDVPVRLVKQLIQVASDQLDEMAPQGVSMMLWGLATLEYKPKKQFLDLVMERVSRDVEAFAERPVALVNTLWGMAKLGYYPRRALVSTMRHYTKTAENAQELLRFRHSQEFTNLFWVFGRCHFDPGEQMLRTSVEYMDANLETLSAMDMAHMSWVWAVLGYSPRGSLLGRIGAAAMDKMKGMDAGTAASLMWSLALLRQEAHPALPKLLHVVEQGFSEGRLTLEQSRQMFQAHLISELGEPVWQPSKELRSAGAVEWITQLTRGAVRNHWAIHALSKELRAMGISHELMHFSPDKLLRADIVIHTVSGGMVAIRVMRRGRDHVRNGLRQTGSYTAWKRLMQGCGYQVVDVYEHEVADFVDDGTGPEVLASALQPFEVEKVSEPLEVNNEFAEEYEEDEYVEEGDVAADAEGYSAEGEEGEVEEPRLR